jgi:hypothetical protein
VRLLLAAPAPELLVGPDVLAKWKGALASTETAFARHRRDLSGAVAP